MERRKGEEKKKWGRTDRRNIEKEVLGIKEWQGRGKEGEGDGEEGKEDKNIPLSILYFVSVYACMCPEQSVIIFSHTQALHIVISKKYNLEPPFCTVILCLNKRKKGGKGKS